MIPYNPHEPLISLHVPRTGGTSLLRSLREWFPDGRLETHYHYRSEAAPAPRYDWRGPMCIHGHFNALLGLGIMDCYPTASQFITFFREPFARFLSVWFFTKDRQRRGLPVDGLEDDPTFETWLHRYALKEAENRNELGILCQLPGFSQQLAESFIFDASLVFVGIMERYTKSLDALSAALGKPTLRLSHENAAIQPVHDFERWRSFYEKNFTREYTVYEGACKINDHMIEALRDRIPSMNT